MPCTRRAGALPWRGRGAWEAGSGVLCVPGAPLARPETTAVSEAPTRSQSRPSQVLPGAHPRADDTTSDGAALEADASLAEGIRSANAPRREAKTEVGHEIPG